MVENLSDIVKWAPSILMEGGEYFSKDFNAFLAERG